MNPKFERRLREQHARVLMRSFDYRQRRHARGVWFELRRVLTVAAAAYVIPECEARQLISEGHHTEPVGLRLEPPKLIVVAPAERIAAIASARPIPIRLGGDLLAAPCLALVRFGSTSSRVVSPTCMRPWPR